MNNNIQFLNRRLSKSVNAGFTLIEIMVVVVIIGVLAVFVVPKVMGRTEQARVASAKQDIATIVSALKMYKLDNQRYPTTDQGLQALVTKPTSGVIPKNYASGGYLELRNDPWGNPYQYMSPGVNGEIDVFSFGADGKPGGQGDDADIGNWNL